MKEHQHIWRSLGTCAHSVEYIQLAASYECDCGRVRHDPVADSRVQTSPAAFVRLRDEERRRCPVWDRMIAQRSADATLAR